MIQIMSIEEIAQSMRQQAELRAPENDEAGVLIDLAAQLEVQVKQLEEPPAVRNNLIAFAARQDNVHTAARLIQDALGIATGDTASHMMPEQDRWQQLRYPSRIGYIKNWLMVECMDVVDCSPTFIPVSTKGD